MQLLDILSDESRWTNYWHAMSADGRGVEADDPSAVQWSIDGAIRLLDRLEPMPNEMYFERGRRLEAAVRRAIHTLHPRRFAFIGQFEREASWSEVRDVLALAGA